MDDWEVNVKKVSKKFNLNNLLKTTGDNFKDKRVTINSEYMTEKYDIILKSNFAFVNFEDNNHYLNFSESELEFLHEENNSKKLTLEDFNKISYNSDSFEGINLKNVKISNSSLMSCFRIKNNKKILNVFVYEQYIEKFNRNVYIIMSYFDRKNIRCVLLCNYIELLLYILKLELELNKKYRFSNIISKYPYEFKDVNIQDLRIYFNNLDNIWLE
jgi:hypothetical protein